MPLFKFSHLSVKLFSGVIFLAGQITRISSNIFFSQSSGSSRMNSNKILESATSTEPWKIFGVEISERANHDHGLSTVTYPDNCSPSNLGTKEGEDSSEPNTDSLAKKLHQSVQDSSSTTRSSEKKDEFQQFDCNSAEDKKLKAEETWGTRNLFDLNVSPIEEDVNHTGQTVDCEIDELHQSEIKSAAETMVSLSKMEVERSEDSLRWFAEIIASS